MTPGQCGYQAPGFCWQNVSNCCLLAPGGGVAFGSGAVAPPPREVGAAVAVGAGCVGCVVPCGCVWVVAAPPDVVPLASGVAVSDASAVAVAVAFGASASPPVTVSSTEPPGTSLTTTFEPPPQPATVRASMAIGTTRRATRTGPPLSEAARPSGGRTWGSR